MVTPFTSVIAFNSPVSKTPILIPKSRARLCCEKTENPIKKESKRRE